MRQDPSPLHVLLSLGVCLVATIVAGCSEEAVGGGCDRDTDCKGSRICEDRVCVPGSGGAGGDAGPMTGGDMAVVSPDGGAVDMGPDLGMRPAPDMGSGPLGALVLEPREELFFGRVQLDTTEVRALTIRNDGAETLRLWDLSLREGGEDAEAEFSRGAGWPESGELMLAPGSEHQLEVRYDAANTTADSGLIGFRSDDPVHPTAQVALSSLSAASSLHIPALVAFGQVEPGTSRWKIVEIQNLGESPVSIREISRSILSSRSFSISYPAQGREDDPEADGSRPPATLAPGAELPVRITFAPQTTDYAEAQFFVISLDDAEAGLRPIRAIGNGGAPCLALSPGGNTLSFGEGQINQENRRSLIVTNCSSTTPLEIPSVDIVSGGGTFSVDHRFDPGLPATLAPQAQHAIDVIYRPRTAGAQDQGVLRIESDDPVQPLREVALTGSGTTNVCPLSVAQGKVDGQSAMDGVLRLEPGKTVLLDSSGSQDPDGSVQQVSWSLVSAPAGSSSRLSSLTAASSTLYLDVAGVYVVDLVVFDDQGLQSCAPSRLEFQAFSQEDVEIELIWDTPLDTDQTDDSGTDLDLHYLLDGRGRWDSPPHDIYWMNPTAEWGAVGPADDPTLTVTDDDGAGPERLVHPSPADGDYRIGVYYYSDVGFGASHATVRVYVSGMLVHESRDKLLMGEGAFWEEGTLDWPSKTFTLVDKIYVGFPP